MSSFFGILGGPLGYVMEFIYKYIVSDYGLSLVLFTLVLRLLMFPLRIKQQKSTARMAAYQPMIQEIQKKYAKDQKRQQEEMMKMQQEYGYSPTAGCLPMVLNMVVLFGIIEVVYRPLTYILHISTDLLDAAATAGNIAGGYAQQSKIIGAVLAGNSGVIAALGEQAVGLIKGFNVFWGNLNLVAMPTISLAGWQTLVFPVLSVLTMIGSQIVIQKTSGQQLQGSMKYTPWIMSAMFIFVGFTVPVGFSLYYTVSNLLMIVESLVARKVYDPAKMKQQIAEEIEEKRKAKKAKKQVTVKTESGEEMKKDVTESELASLRLQRARELDAARYADERTAPLTEEERAAQEEEAKSRKKGKKSAPSKDATETLLEQEKEESEKQHLEDE
ncbi:MAG: YidC/Oxa1 family membrane protein insertase [Pygmaiobacter sp.]|jgi:YidC/Oxa1 family membrane protein insertase|nr:YidC/Oxa1 family membrane protein insertase [Pygmaiobacter sp.]